MNKTDEQIDFEEMIMSLIYSGDHDLIAPVWRDNPQFHKIFKKRQLVEIVDYLMAGIIIRRRTND